MTEKTEFNKAHRTLMERLEREGISEPRVLSAMQEVPRHLFMPEEMRSRAYEDNALPIEEGQTISQPYIVARMTSALCEEKILDKVLEIGTGSGYQADILSKIAKQVYSI